MTLRIIAGTFKGRLLKTPKGSSTRPTQGVLREAVFNICQHEVIEARLLDLFSGSGAIAFEALSRGASHVTLVEPHRAALSCIRENIKTLQVESHTRVFPTTATRALTLLTQEAAQFDLIYVDPPYDKPLILDAIAPLLAPHGLLFLEKRYEPGQEEPISSPLLTCESRRRFGVALLTIFRKN